MCGDGRWIFLGRRGRVLVLWFFLSGKGSGSETA